jgi:ribonuclease R
VTVLRVLEIEDGQPLAIPDSWQPDDGAPPPRIRIIEPRGKGRAQAALKVGDRVLARTEEAGRGLIAHVMKKLPTRTEQVLGVVEFDGAGKPWLAPVDKRVRNAVAIADLGGAAEGQLVLGEPVRQITASRPESHRSAWRSAGTARVQSDRYPQARHSLRVSAGSAGRGRIGGKACRSRKMRARTCATCRSSPSIRPTRAITTMRSGLSRMARAGSVPLVAIADVSFYVRPGGAVDREARKRGNSVYFPDRVVPMLPHVLSSDVCSLKVGADRAAMACHLTIDAEGRVTGWRFTRALVRIAEVIAYEEAQRRIDAREAAAHLQNLWARMAAARESTDQSRSAGAGASRAARRAGREGQDCRDRHPRTPRCAPRASRTS